MNKFARIYAIVVLGIICFTTGVIWLIFTPPDPLTFWLLWALMTLMEILAYLAGVWSGGFRQSTKTQCGSSKAIEMNEFSQSSCERSDESTNPYASPKH
jgi:hypothetical protein